MHFSWSSKELWLHNYLNQIHAWLLSWVLPSTLAYKSRPTAMIVSSGVIGTFSLVKREPGHCFLMGNAAIRGLRGKLKVGRKIYFFYMIQPCVPSPPVKGVYTIIGHGSCLHMHESTHTTFGAGCCDWWMADWFWLGTTTSKSYSAVRRKEEGDKEVGQQVQRTDIERRDIGERSSN